MLKNKRGFNLFTALIALMLVSITIVFVYNMVQTEENYLSLIQDQSKTSDLMTIADLSRADAFNIFVVSFRERWAEYRSEPENVVTITRQFATMDWNGFIENYANKIFFDNSFETYFALSVTESLEYTNPPLGYTITIPDYNQVELADIIGKAFIASDEKIKVIGCEQASDFCIGTLYFKIDTRKLSSTDYEKLPMIVVKRNIDDQVIQRPVFARREYRIYLPWRGFQAMRTVRNFALGVDLEKEENSEYILNNLYNSKGFLNPHINYALNSAKVGICDIDSCAPRTDLYKTVTKNGFIGAECKAPEEVINFQANNGNGIIVLGTTINLSDSFDYNLQTSHIQSIFLDLLETTVKNNLDNRSFIGYEGGLKLTSENGLSCLNNLTSNYDFEICDVKMLSNSKITKNISEKLINFNGSLTTLTSDTFDILFFNKASNLGLSIDADGNLFNLNDTSVINQVPDNQYLRCHTPKKSSLLFEFNETNPRYILSNETTKIYVKLEDSYSQYSFFDPVPLASLNNNGYFNLFTIVDQTSDPGWSCKTYEAGESGTAACVSN